MKKPLKTINILLTLLLTILILQTIKISLRIFKTKKLYTIKNTFLNSSLSKPSTSYEKSKTSKFEHKNIFGVSGHNNSKKKELPSFHHRLRGTIVSDSLPSLAILEDIKTKKQNIYAKNDVISQHEIISIERKYVILKTPSGDNSSLWLDKHPDTKTTTDTSVTKIGLNMWTVKEELITNSLNDINTFLKQVRIVPYFKNGSSSGFMLNKIQKESFLQQIGFKNGDILKAINGIMIANPYSAVKALKSLMANSKKNFTLLIERGSQTITFSYKIM